MITIKGEITLLLVRTSATTLASAFIVAGTYLPNQRVTVSLHADSYGRLKQITR